jgi:predicted PurR-regulated permease PerM
MADERKHQKQALFWFTLAMLFVLAVLTLQEILLPFVAGLVIAYALNPLVDRIERLGLGRLLASLLIVLVLLVVFVVVLVFLVPILVSQAEQLIASIPGELERLRPIFDKWARARLGAQYADISAALDEAFANIGANWTSYAAPVLQSLWDRGQAIIDFISLVLITPIVVFYLLVDWPQMMARLGDWLPRDHEATLRRLAGEMDAAIGAFIRGQGIVCLVLGTIYTVGLTLIDLQYGLLIGIATGVMSFVPVVGTVLGLITASIVAVIQGWPDLTLWGFVVLIFGIGQALDAGFLSPRVVGPKVGLHPVALIFSLFVFSYLFGFVGVLVAVPMAAAIGVLIRFGLSLYLASPIYRGGGQDEAGSGRAPLPGADENDKA